jgi:hypothetical protein
LASDPEHYAADVTGLNGATFSMVPVQLQSEATHEVPFAPGPNKAKLFLTWPKTSMGKHIEMPFVAKPGEHYHLTYGKEKEKYAVTLLDSHEKMVQKLTFSIVSVTTTRVVPMKIKVR